MTSAQAGYAFTQEDITKIRDVLGRIQQATGVNVTAETGSTSGFAALVLGIDDSKLEYKNEIILVQSRRDKNAALYFEVLLADKELIGPEGGHNTLLEALIFAQVFLQRMIDHLLAKRENDLPTSPNELPAFKNNVIASKVLSPEEVHYTQAYANELGKISGLRGFANFVEAQAGVVSIALGVFTKDVPTMLGTVVVVLEGGGRSCSVRDFRNDPMPGPSYYTSLYAALVTTKPLFEKLAILTAKHSRPSLLGRLFGR